MTEFKVQCFNGGIADGIGFRQIEAEDQKSAAEKACGCKVRGESGKPGELCAEVLIVNGFPLSRTMFYADNNLS